MDELDLGATVKGFIPGQKLFKRYTLTRILGRGGMGVVWLARDDKLERDVALKFLPETVAADERALDDLKRETRRSLELTHPHIVRIYDFVDDARTAAIAMEYVDGRTLSKLALDQPDRTFPVATLRPWVEQLCAALDYAHGQARVVHRDLKPANLMVDAAGRLKIADFGISATLSDSTTRVSKQAGTSGTPVYMSPQQMMGEKPAVTDDIYSLGATLYDLLTGKPPFYSGNILLQVQNKVPPSVAERRAELGVSGEAIPPEWEATIAACLAKEPKDRPQSAGEVAERLGLTTKTTKVTKPEAKVERPDLRAGRDGGNLQASLPGQSKIENRKSKIMAAVAVIAAAVALGWWFGIHAPEQRRLELARLQAQQAEAARLAAARGGLIIRTDPAGAEVAVGGVGVERSPATFREMRLGAYEVTVTKAGHEPQTLRLSVEENRFTQPAVVTLAPTVGGVELTSEPTGLDFELRSTRLVSADLPAVRRTGKTPATLSDLPIGDYRVTYRRSGWPEQVREVAVAKGGTARAVAEFVPGSLELTSTPSGAEVYAVGRDGPPGRPLGTTPYRVAEALPGRYEFELRLAGHKAATASVTVQPRLAARGSVALEKEPHIVLEGLGLEMRHIPAGSFQMGGAGNPTQQVTISRPFWLGKTEVTQGQWQAVMGNNPSHFKGSNLPAENVSWADAMEFCRKLTERERAAGRLPAGYVYTLPTEAQWEYACRAGTTGDYAGNLDAMGWYSGNAGGSTKPVGTKAANAWGLHDMHGNVWEWCLDWYGNYPGGSVTDPTGPASGSFRVARGGGWGSTADLCRSADRNGSPPGNRNGFLGFRPALSSVR
ncbi:MAG: SUMF1/EgtB/PvdO family nonheme iron enzyme [Opitutaceae bacterium]|nr:SUMF1/EgtB/PvdO family nonheme iron enzyme [Opitutaceae bacterium]